MTILSFSRETFAQKFAFKNISSEQGVPSLEIIDVLQDSTGFIWFTTLNGVAKYDGRTVKMIKKKDGLSGNFTRKLFLDSKNRLWVSTFGQGINYFSNDSLYSFSSDSTYKWRGAGNFTEDDMGNIWILGANDIVCFDGKKFIEYDTIHTISGISDVLYKDGVLWISTTNKGLYSYNIKNKSYQNFNVDNGLRNNICYTVFVDSENQLWAGCYGGLSLVKSDTILSFNISEDFNKNRVKKIIEDENGFLWLALYGNGIAKWDKKNYEIIQFYNEKNGLKHPFSNSILMDRDKNIWVATDGEGVFLLNDFSVQIFDTDYGFSSNQINSFNIKKDHIQVLTVNGGEILFYEDTLINNLITFHNNEIVSLNTSIELNDTIWYGTSAGLRFRLNESEDFQKVKNVSPVSDNTLASILVKNRPFFSGIESVYTVEGKKLIIFDSKDHKQNVSPLALCIDGQSNVWTANFSSIAFLNIKDSTLYPYLPSRKLRHFYSDCIGYKDKIYFVGEDYFETISFKDNDTIFKQHDVLRKVGVEMALSIMIKNDTVYIGHNKGFTYFNLNDIDNKNIAYTNLTPEDGIPDEGVQVIKVDKKGVFWMGSYQGLVMFDPSLRQQVNHPPKVYLTQTELFSEVVSLDTLTELNYNQNHLTFKWSTIAFNKINQIEFTYFLDGFDEAWSKPTKDLKTTYKKLPPGHYQFKIKTRYNGQVWSDENILASFYIDAPFYQKWWFILMIFLIISAIIANLVYSVIITKKQKNTLQKFSKELIKSQEKERSKISKDLHDSVGQLLLFVRNKLKSTTDNNNLVNELDLALNEVRSISRQLHPYQLEKFGLTKAIELLVEKANDNSEIFFSDELDNIDNLFNKDTELSIYRIIQESINNVIKHSNAKSAKIEIEKQTKQIKLLIRDNGTGFDAKNILSGKKHTFGLTGIIERVKIINGGITIESSENGTLFKIYIPL